MLAEVFLLHFVKSVAAFNEVTVSVSSRSGGGLLAEERLTH